MSRRNRLIDARAQRSLVLAGYTRVKPVLAGHPRNIARGWLVGKLASDMCDLSHHAPGFAFETHTLGLFPTKTSDWAQRGESVADGHQGDFESEHEEGGGQQASCIQGFTHVHLAQCVDCCWSWLVSGINV